MSDESVYQDAPKTQEYGHTTTAPTPTVKAEPEAVEKEKPGMFDFLRSKKPVEEKKYEEPAISSSEYEQKVDHVPEPQHKSEEQPQTLLQKLNITDSKPKSEEYGHTTAPTVKVEPETVEKEDRGMLDFLGKKKPEEEKKSEEKQKVDHHVPEPQHKSEEQSRETLLQKMLIPDSEPKSEEYGHTTTTTDPTVKAEPETVEKEDRGMLDFLGKKKPEEEKKSEYEQKVDHVREPEHKSEEQSHETLFQKMHTSHGEHKSEEYGHTAPPTEKVEPETVEKEDRGMFDFLGKKKPEEEKKYEEPVISSEYEQKVDHVHEPQHKSEEQPETLFQKMNISHSDTSDDEECADGEHSLTEQLKEKIEERKEMKEEAEMTKKLEDDNRVPIEKYEDEVVAPPPQYTDVGGDHTPTDVVHHETPVTEEKKGFMEKIKEKLPGSHKKHAEEQVVASPPPTPAAAMAEPHEGEVEQPEKKGILSKIKEKISGHHSKSEEEKEK